MGVARLPRRRSAAAGHVRGPATPCSVRSPRSTTIPMPASSCASAIPATTHHASTWSSASDHTVIASPPSSTRRLRSATARPSAMGTVVLAGAVTTTAVSIGEHVAVMPHCVFTHDDRIGSFATFGAGVRLAGARDDRRGRLRRVSGRRPRGHHDRRLVADRDGLARPRRRASRRGLGRQPGPPPATGHPSRSINHRGRRGRLFDSLTESDSCPPPQPRPASPPARSPWSISLGSTPR